MLVALFGPKLEALNAGAVVDIARLHFAASHFVIFLIKRQIVKFLLFVAYGCIKMDALAYETVVPHIEQRLHH